MNLVARINEIINRKSLISGNEVETIIQNSDFAKTREKIVKAINSEITYPNLNALVLTQKIPDKKYEKKLLKYKMEDMQDYQAIAWMLSLGEIKSEEGFEKIKPYTKTELFHQAFISMAKIDVERTMKEFEEYLNQNSHLYNEKYITTRHESGFFTLTMLFEHGSPEKLVANYDFSNESKKKLVDDAKNHFKDYMS